MNFGQNLYQWFLSNAQSLVLMAIVVIGIYLGFKHSMTQPNIFHFRRQRLGTWYFSILPITLEVM